MKRKLIAWGILLAAVACAQNIPPTVQVTSIAGSGGGITTPVSIANGGTGSTTAAAANQALIPATTSLTESSNAVTINWASGNTFTVTLNANLSTVTFSNPVDGQCIVVAVTNTASNYTVTWGNSIKWSGGSQPTQTVGAHTDVWTIVDIGGTYYGNAVQNY